MVVLENEQALEEEEEDLELELVVVEVDLDVVVVEFVSSAAKTQPAKIANNVTKLNFIVANLIF